MASILIQNVGKTYPGGVRALNRVSLEIPDRQFVVLVGPSGCGKSTLLRMIAGLEEVTEGTISIGGRAVNAVPSKDRDVAMVFQNYALYPHMSVFDNMAFGLRMRRVPRAEIQERVTAAAGLLGLAPLLQRKPRQLSGGQAQRVALGRAIVRQPAAFLFDEPLSNLDAQHRAIMRRELVELHRRLQTTMVLVTHDQVEAMTLGEQIVVMHAGEVQQAGPPRTVYDAPANQFVAGFLGTPSMNLFAAEVRRHGGSLSVHVAHLCWPLPDNLPRPPADGTSLVLGIRPEDFQPVATGGPSGPVSLEAVPDDVQDLGHELLVFFRFAGIPCVARVPAQVRVSRGAPIRFLVSTDRIHLFDPGGQNLRRSPVNLECGG